MPSTTRTNDRERPGNEHLAFLGQLCASCGNCCREPIVILTDHDIRRLVAATGMKASEFVTTYSRADLAFDPGWEGWVRLPRRKQALALLKRNRDQPDEVCLFLDTEGRCTVYPHRPAACRTFPFEDVELDEGGRVVSGTMNGCNECRFLSTDARRIPDLTALQELEETEDDDYCTRAAAWNRGTGRGGLAEYLAYLGFD